jgi:diguanylate cyclase (GGDEF)-like protein
LSVDVFVGALFCTSLRGLQVLQANAYFYQLCQLSPDMPVALSALMTPAANIMLDTYVIPLLLNQGSCEEIQLTLQVATKQEPRRLPVLVNAKLQQDGTNDPVVYWLMTLATQRDCLYQQLVDLRNALEAKADRLEQLSQTDELTGMLNRRAFNSRSLALLNQRQRQGGYAVFLLLDIDFFKQVNDSYGHAVGDNVLVEVAQRIKSGCRSHDVVARIGGEEFAMVLLLEQAAQGLRLAEKIRRLIAAQPVAGVTLTVSIGMACSDEVLPAGTGSMPQAATISAPTALTQVGHSVLPGQQQGLLLQSQFELLYKLADRRLYQAKASGRDQVVAAG